VQLTRKDRKLVSGITLVDNLIGGGIVRGKVSKILGAAASSSPCSLPGVTHDHENCRDSRGA
jgi:hypothetical protein